MTPVYFLACMMLDALIVSRFHDAILIAMPNIRTRKHIADITRWVDQGKKLIIDSGVFEVCSHHARAHGLSLTGALSLPPEQLDGFPQLLDHYLKTAKLLPDTFALVEIDVGGRESKIRTRAYLESEGLTVCPVFHPIIDGWDYLDELAKKYPTIFVGNMVDASVGLRLKIMARLQQWMQQHPETWLHLLGVTPSPTLVSMPTHSCDSSAWLASVKYSQGRWMGTALWNKLGGFTRELSYARLKKDRDKLPGANHQKSKAVVCLDEHCQALMNAHYASRFEDQNK